VFLPKKNFIPPTGVNGQRSTVKPTFELFIIMKNIQAFNSDLDHKNSRRNFYWMKNCLIIGAGGFYPALFGKTSAGIYGESR